MGIDGLIGVLGFAATLLLVYRIIMFHLRRSPALREFLIENFERFPFTG